jgi:hypothetical protein
VLEFGTYGPYAACAGGAYLLVTIEVLESAGLFIYYGRNFVSVQESSEGKPEIYPYRFFIFVYVLLQQESLSVRIWIL